MKTKSWFVRVELTDDRVTDRIIEAPNREAAEWYARGYYAWKLRSILNLQCVALGPAKGRRSELRERVRLVA